MLQPLVCAVLAMATPTYAAVPQVAPTETRQAASITATARLDAVIDRAIADHHCLVESYETNLVLLFTACEGGGGLDPSTIAGRENAIGGGGVESGIP